MSRSIRWVTMTRLLVDYNRCLWYALMRVLDRDIKGLASYLGVQRQTVHRWIEGRGRGPRRDSYLKIVEMLTGGQAGRQGFEGAYDVLAAETGKDRSTLRSWASAPEPMQEGNRLVALGVWHRLGYPIKSYRAVDFDRRLVEVRQGRRNPRARLVKGFGYLSPNPFELWPWPVPDRAVARETERPSIERFRQDAARNREIERRRTGRTP